MILYGPQLNPGRELPPRQSTADVYVYVPWMVKPKLFKMPGGSPPVSKLKALPPPPLPPGLMQSVADVYVYVPPRMKLIGNAWPVDRPPVSNGIGAVLVVAVCTLVPTFTQVTVPFSGIDAFGGSKPWSVILMVT